MSQLTVCDVCHVPRPCPFKVTEKDGTVYDICSGPCYNDHAKRMEATK